MASNMKLTVKEKITRFLDKNEGKGYRATRIASMLRLNYNTVRRALGELMNMGYVYRKYSTKHGVLLYHAVI